MIAEKPRGKRITKYKGAEEESVGKSVPILARNENQQSYIDALKKSSQVIALGPSGTGKTWIPVTYACNLYLGRKIDKIILTRPAVSVGKSLGALPGDMAEKYGPWLSPLLTTMEEQMGKGVVETSIKNGNIRMAPLEYMRGSSFNDAFVICDEAQNLTVEEFKMLATRIGENCTFVLSGDIRQSDIKQQSGLSKAIHLAKKYQMSIPVIEFTVDDIVRSDVCKEWIKAFYEEGL
jgi:phosphate starvation-inducible PhoH-like protein